MNKQPQLNSLATDQAFSNSSFRTNSHKQLIEQSFGETSNLVQSSHQCAFCSCKEVIMKQLFLLKQVIEAKNQKIKELEQFIHRLSNMVLSQSTEPNVSTAEMHQLKTKNEPFYASGKEQVNNYFQWMSNSSKAKTVSDKVSNQASISSQLEKNKTPLIPEEDHRARTEIKKEIERINLRKKSQMNQNLPPKENKLRSKLIEIINVLPAQGKNESLLAFESLSQPLSEGIPAEINQKLSSSKAIKHSSFLKKPPNPHQSFESQKSSKYPSQQPESSKVSL